MSGRILLDTNVRISASIFFGPPLDVVKKAKLPTYQPIVSRTLLHELQEVLVESFGWSQSTALREVERVADECLMIEPDIVINICRDPDDNRVLECAVSGHAEVIVTGDKDLLALHPFRDVQILTVRQFLDSI